jgi:flagella basal body P-ring formation protein FlgA
MDVLCQAQDPRHNVIPELYDANRYPAQDKTMSCLATAVAQYAVFARTLYAGTTINDGLAPKQLRRATRCLHQITSGSKLDAADSPALCGLRDG